MRYSESFAENDCRLDTKKRTNSPDYGAAVGGAEGSGTFYGKLSQALLNLLAAVIVRQIASVRQEKRSRINEIISYIHSHYYEDLKLECLAQRFISAPISLQGVQAYTNSTLVNYINVTRIMNAQRSFMETDKNVTQISQEVGFSSLTHFNRVFKAVTGTTLLSTKDSFVPIKLKQPIPSSLSPDRLFRLADIIISRYDNCGNHIGSNSCAYLTQVNIAQARRTRVGSMSNILRSRHTPLSIRLKQNGIIVYS
ncbi:MAG: helix-turn-helix domain-containing protein [Eisenbergiella massiliensis]